MNLENNLASSLKIQEGYSPTGIEETTLSRQHPLLINVVIERIFDQLDLPDIKNFILVSRVQYEESERPILWLKVGQLYNVFQKRLGLGDGQLKITLEEAKDAVKKILENSRIIVKKCFSNVLDYPRQHPLKPEIESLLKSTKITDIYFCKKICEARDALIVWNKIAQKIGKVPQLVKIDSLEKLIFVANGFQEWCDQNKDDLAIIIELNLASLDLTSLPPEIGNLINLQDLYAENNQLTGGLPAEINNLNNLQNLYVTTSAGRIFNCGQLKRQLKSLG